jgi:acyl-ACP thioesterase
VRVSDLDTNRHANSGCYIDWFVESVPHALITEGTCAELEVIYKKEALLGDSLMAVSSHSVDNVAGRKSYSHTVQREDDGALLAYGRSAWRL